MPVAETPSKPEVSSKEPLAEIAAQPRIAWIGLLVFVALLGIADMPSLRWIGDPDAWREETRSLLHWRGLAVDPRINFAPGRGNDPGQYFVRNERNGLLYSKFGVVNSLMSLPPM